MIMIHILDPGQRDRRAPEYYPQLGKIRQD